MNRPVHVSSLNLTPHSMVCRPCRDDVTRVLSSPSCVPRWEKGKGCKVSSNCCITDCSSTSVTVTTEEILNKRGFTCRSATIPMRTPLCKTHYHMVNDNLQSRKKSCGARLKPGSHRPCQQPDIIQTHLREKTWFKGEIYANDHVCMSCYKSHHIILQDNPVVSTDCDLNKLLDSIVQQIPNLDELVTYHVLDVAMIKTVVRVGKVLLEIKLYYCLQFTQFIDNKLESFSMQRAYRNPKSSLI